MANEVLSAIDAFKLTKDILAQSNAPHQVVMALVRFYEALIAQHTPAPAQEELAHDEVQGRLRAHA